MRKLIAAAAALFVISIAVGQAPRTGAGNMNVGRFYGKIIDEQTEKGVDAASVQLITSRGGKDTIIAGMLTRKSGEFSLENLPLAAKFRLAITAIGYKSYEKPVSFDLKFGQGQDPAQA